MSEMKCLELKLKWIGVGLCLFPSKWLTCLRVCLKMNNNYFSIGKHTYECELSKSLPKQFCGFDDKTEFTLWNKQFPFSKSWHFPKTGIHFFFEFSRKKIAKNLQFRDFKKNCQCWHSSIHLNPIWFLFDNMAASFTRYSVHACVRVCQLDKHMEQMS